jgi:hypothetical protein
MQLNTILDIILNQRLGVVEYGIDELYPEIHANLLNNTLPIFSQYFPCERRYNYEPEDHPTETKWEYYLNIPELKEAGLEMISVAEVLPQSTVIDSIYYDGRRPVNMRIEDVIMNSLVTNTASLVKASYKMFRFIPPNRISLRGFGTNKLRLTLKIKYPSFSSIEDSVIEQFLDLATADIKIFLYNKLKHYDQLTLPIGNIDLKLDELSTGKDDRREVIDRFNSKGFPNKAISNYYKYE